MILTFDLCRPCKLFQQWPFKWRLRVPSFIEIPPLSEEISRQAYIIGVNERTDGQTADPKTEASRRC